MGGRRKLICKFYSHFCKCNFRFKSEKIMVHFYHYLNRTYIYAKFRICQLFTIASFETKILTIRHPCLLLQRFHLWSLKWVLCKMLHKESPLGRKSKLLSVYRVGLAIGMHRDGLALLPFGLFGRATVENFISKWQVCDFTMLRIFGFNQNFSDLIQIFRI